MGITRRDFLRYCGASAAVIGLSSLDLRLLEKALASPTAPTVIWLQGSSCTGCSISFIDRISSSAPYTTKEVLTDAVNLTFHPTLMATAGESAVANAKKAYDAGNYILVVEGGVPTIFDGHTCVVWSFGGQEVTMKDAVQQYASKAAAIICVGNCASFGGMSAAPPNVTSVQSVKTATGKSPICVAGCPPHPDWMVYVIAKLLGGQTLALDSYGRPTDIYGRTVHSICPRRSAEDGSFGRDGLCLEELGCRGPSTYANCPTVKWNNGVQWCIGANAPCIGCTSPTFPGSSRFF